MLLSMLLYTTLYPVIALLLARLVLVEDPFWILLPPGPCVWERFRSPWCKEHLPWRTAVFITCRNVYYLGCLPLWTALWTVDDLFFADYRKQSLGRATFVLGGFRTGTTSLHRSLALDEAQFASPRFIELGLPFLSIQRLLDFFETLDRTRGTAIIAGIERKLQQAMGPEVMKRHPMHWYAAEEDDVLFAAWNWSGYYATLHCPTRDWKLTAGQFSRMPRADVERAVTCYERTMQKMLWRRGGGRDLLSKSHLVELMPFLRERFPTSRFVGIQRHPKDAIPSWYALARSATAALTFYEPPQETYVGTHLAFWDAYYAAEASFFRDAAHSLPPAPAPSEADLRKVRLRFSEFVGDRRGACQAIYKAFDLPFEGSMLETALADAAAAKAHKDYKKDHDYSNPTLADLGLDLSDVEERYKDYLQEARIAPEAPANDWEVVRSK